MGFFQSLKDDLSEAVDGLLGEDESIGSSGSGDAVPASEAGTSEEPSGMDILAAMAGDVSLNEEDPLDGVDMDSLLKQLDELNAEEAMAADTGLVGGDRFEDELQKLLAGTLNSLPKKQRECLILYYYQQKPVKEIAEMLGVSESTVKTNKGKALDTLRRNGCVALQNADKILFIPDALIYMLTGEAVCEYTVASTSQILNPRTGDLDTDLLAALGLTRQHFGRLVQPGECVGTLTPQVQSATGLGAISVVAVAAHDTASAVAAVPAKDDCFAYLSCGTWSLLGVESPTPIINADSFAENFTNEGGIDHTTRFLKNITGLWLYEQCRKEWKGDGGAAPAAIPSDVNELNALCLHSSCDSILDPDDPRFAHPASMTAAICDYLRETQQPLPVTPADYVRVIFRSLAARYRVVIEVLRRLTAVDIRRLHVIGGGSRNEYLMQFTADALQMPVIAGPQEGTALGNALVQVRAAGLVDSLAAMRSIIANSITLKTYLPAL